MSATEIESLLARTNTLEEFDFMGADTILRNATVFARNLFGIESSHVAELSYILFRPHDIVYNTGHFKNRVVWNEGVERLWKVLNAMAYELKIAKTKGGLLPPEKVTLKWLFNHVSVAGWFIAWGFIVGVFAMGFSFAKHDELAKIVSLLQ